MAKDDYYIDEEFYKSISSVSQYMGYIEEYINQLKSDMIRDEYLAFRGQSNAEYQLVPSIARPLKHRPDVQMIHFEKELVYSAQHEYPQEFLNVKSPIELLIKLQHYGIPTRLLDITTNALVALYFACNDSMDKDGEVFVFKIKRDYHWNAPMAELIADTYRLEIEEKSIQEYYEIFKNQVYFYATDLLNDDSYMEEDNGFYQFRNELANSNLEPIVIQPPRTFSRLNAQSGQFLLFTKDLCYELGNTIPVEVDSAISGLEKNHKLIRGIIQIPCVYKEKIMRDLEVLGITKSSLFHDNIDIVCKEVVENINKRTIKE